MAEGRQGGTKGPSERTGYAACTPRSEERRGVQKPLSSLETLYLAWDLQNATSVTKWQEVGEGRDSGLRKLWGHAV